MGLSKIALFCIGLFAILAFATASTHLTNTPRTLIYYTSPSFKSDYSLFINSLTAKGHSLSFVNPVEDIVLLTYFDKPNYDNVFVFCGHISHEKVNGFPATKDFETFLQHGGSVWVAPVDGVLSNTFRELTQIYGVEYLDAAVQLLDIEHPTSRFLTTPLPQQDSFILHTNAANPTPGNVAIYGSAMYTVDNVGYLQRVLTGSATTAAYDFKQQKLHESGNNLSLLTAIQLKQNQRMLLMSDVSLLSNTVLNMVDYENYNTFVNGAVCWVVHDCGYVRVRNLQHYKFNPTDELEQTNHYVFTKQRIIRNNIHSNPNTTTIPPHEVIVNPKAYKVGEHIHFDLLLEVYNPYTKAWDLTQSTDMIFDATCLHSHIKFPVEPQSAMVLSAKDASVYSIQPEINQHNIPVEFTLPDHMGVFKISFSTNQAFSDPRSTGISFLSPDKEKQMVVNVRPFAHDEWPRYAFVAYPYYLGFFITMIASVVFSYAFLYTK